jgi:hypothetical protein
MDSSWAPQSPDLSSYHSADVDERVHPQHHGYRGSVSHQVPQHTPPLSSPSAQHTSVPRYSYQLKMQDADYIPDASLAPQMQMQMPELGNGASGGSMLPPNIDSITIKNHFPVARIKRIMQADDDVGKVAQVTPVVVCTWSCNFSYVCIASDTP